MFVKQKIVIWEANYDNNVGHPFDVGSYSSNPFGLYDMSGNVWEWCNDSYGGYSGNNLGNPTGSQTGSSRVKRGGSCLHATGDCRSACRYFSKPTLIYGSTGFSVVRRPDG